MNTGVKIASEEQTNGFFVSIYLSIYLNPIYLSTSFPYRTQGHIYLSKPYLSIRLSVYIFIYLSVANFFAIHIVLGTELSVYICQFLPLRAFCCSVHCNSEACTKITRRSYICTCGFTVLMSACVAFCCCFCRCFCCCYFRCQ